MSVPERHRLQGRLEERADRADRRARSALRDSVDRSVDQLDRNRQAWREMGPRERQRMRRRLERFRELSASEQQEAIDRHFADRSTQERARILERMRSAAGRLPGAQR